VNAAPALGDSTASFAVGCAHMWRRFRGSLVFA